MLPAVRRRTSFERVATGSQKLGSGSYVAETEAFARAGQMHELAGRLDRNAPADLNLDESVRLRVTKGSALFHQGDVCGAIEVLRAAADASKECSIDVRFVVALALFERSALFTAPDQSLKDLTVLRQLATSIGDAPSLAALHFAVARLEACRGSCSQARRHLEVARRLAEQCEEATLLCSVDQVESALELVVGNLGRAKHLAIAAARRADMAGLALHKIASLGNLGTVALLTGYVEQAKHYLESVIQNARDTASISAQACDTLAQLALYSGELDECERLIRECDRFERRARVPAPSWSHLAHAVTKCYWNEARQNWEAVLFTVDSVDDDARNRQFRPIRAPLLCAKARALSRLGEANAAQSALAAAVKWSAPGAIDPLIVVEVSRAVSLAAVGQHNSAKAHFDRAAGAARAIQHSFYERWIARQRQETLPTSIPISRPDPDISGAALLLTDVATILGAGQSIDLVTHRAAGLLESVFAAGRVQVANETGREYRSEFSTNWEQNAESTVKLHIRGSDRAVTIEVSDVQSLDELSLVKSVADLVRAAVQRTSEGDADDEEQNLWPRAVAPGDDDHVFRSPRMAEILRIAIRLATAPLPILLTGETGTGKEVLAHIIHDHSHVKRGPFLPYNCSSMSRGIDEQL
jgi:tetratricopeptide (TPR) repeat protein